MFNLGNIYVTRGIMDTIPESEWIKALRRHMSGDWGDVCKEDWEANNDAVVMGFRIVSAYTTEDGKKFWIITEADRSATTILLPEEY